MEALLNQTPFLVRLSSFFVSFFLITPNAAPATRIRHNFSQTPASSAASPQRDTQALTLASLSVQALLGSQTLSDATLQGTANYTAGYDQESGSVTREVKGNQESKLVLNLTGGTRQEIRQLQAGAWVGTDGQKHALALHNCWTDASSLLPVFSLQAALANPQIAAVYVGQSTVNGTTADHLQLSQVFAGQAQQVTTQIQQLSSIDIYLDASSHCQSRLPLAPTRTTTSVVAFP
jgi:hypothetical protein